MAIVARHLFEVLSNPQDPTKAPEAVSWNLVLNKVPGLGLGLRDQRKAVDRLVALSLLRFVGCDEQVAFYSRARMWAFLEVYNDEMLKQSQGCVADRISP